MRALVKGLNINYKIIGEGSRGAQPKAGRMWRGGCSLLILHGWGSQSAKWQRVGELLAEKGIKAVIPDLPGFGESEKPKTAWNLDDYCDFIQEFINKLGLLNKFYLLGHSFGGALAVKFCLKFPEKIDKLFLVGAACIRRKSFKKRFFYILSKIFPSPFLFKKFFYKFIVKSDYLSVQGVMKETYLKIIAEDLSEYLSKIQIPTVIIWGEEDDITPIKDAYLIKEKIQNSRLRQGFGLRPTKSPSADEVGGQAKLEIIPMVGHDVNLKTPEELSKLIIQNL